MLSRGQLLVNDWSMHSRVSITWLVPLHIYAHRTRWIPGTTCLDLQREDFIAVLKMASLLAISLNIILNNPAKQTICFWKFESPLRLLKLLALNKAKNNPNAFLPWRIKCYRIHRRIQEIQGTMYVYSKESFWNFPILQRKVSFGCLANFRSFL